MLETTKKPLQLALEDIWESLKNYQLWWHLSWSELKRNYNRTLFGPFWATISAAIFITALGLVYSKLWGHELAKYLPFVCASYLTWNLISLTLNESTNTFINAEVIIKELPIKLTIFALDTVCRNLLNFMHCLLVYLIIMILFKVPVHFKTLLFVPNLVLVLANLTWMVLCLGLLCARFRDFKPIMTSVLQIAFFTTPVLWEPERLKNTTHLFFVNLNPFYHLINLIRNPLLGQLPLRSNYVFSLGLLLLGWLFTTWCFSRARPHLIFWI